MTPLLLASQSTSRARLLSLAGLPFESVPARIDEATILSSLVAEGAAAHDVADALAEMKARKIAEKHPDRLVLGCDQVLALGAELFSKPRDRDEAAAHLARMQGQTHRLLSAALIYEDAQPVWRKVGVARLTMHALSDDEIARYLDLAWPDVAGSVGAYMAEDIGARLFSRIEGDWFSVLGLPLLDIAAYLRLRGERPW